MNLRISLTVFFVLFVFIMHAQINTSAKIVALQLKENKPFPNNTELPVLLYKNVFGSLVTPELIEKTLAQNNWKGSWRNGIYNFQHYHSTAHEALGVYSGWAEVQLGGSGNNPVKIEKGDLVVLPTGTAHKRIDSGGGFRVVGAYPDGQNWDMNYGKEKEFEQAKSNIAQVKRPKFDPVFGEKGKLFDFWK